MCKTPEDLDLDGITTVAVDLETYDPNLKTKGLGAIRGDGFVCGVAIATGKDTVYFPINHSDIHMPLDKKIKFWEALDEKLFQNEKITKVFHNAMYDVCWIRAVTGKKMKGRIVDTMIAGSVIDENRFKYSLDSLCKDFKIGRKGGYDLQEKTLAWSEGTIKDPMSNMHKLPASIVKDYAKQDVDLTLKLWKLFDKKLDEVLYIKPEDNEKKTSRSIFELETKLFPCLVDMRFKGVRVNLEHAANLKKNLMAREAKIISKIKELTGIDVEIHAARSIAKAFDKLKLPYDRTEKANEPSFTKNFLQNHPHELARSIADAREINKAHTTFIDSITKHSAKGRIHADINQIRSDQGGTVTGRFSMSNPNLQQIPARHPELGPMIRSIFIPEENTKWGSFDYSQQEPRILVHYAKLQNLEGVDEIVDAYNAGDADFHQVVADMAGIERKQAKTINLGLMYGMGKNKLMAELGLMKESAEKLIRQYHVKAPFVKQLMDNVTRKAEDRGKIRTLGGRACHFDLWQPTQFGIFKPLPLEMARKEYDEPLKRAFTYKALNKLIQGSAADMTKKSMVALYENGIIPHIQIHDEVDISVESDAQAEKIIEIMESAVELKVPNKVDYEQGANWGEIK